MQIDRERFSPRQWISMIQEISFFDQVRVSLFAVLLGVVGCGVKGDPLPPLTPAELGRGVPTYKGATEELAYPQVPPLKNIEPKDDLDDLEKEDAKNKELDRN